MFTTIFWWSWSFNDFLRNGIRDAYFLTNLMSENILNLSLYLIFGMFGYKIPIWKSVLIRILMSLVYCLEEKRLFLLNPLVGAICLLLVDFNDLPFNQLVLKFHPDVPWGTLYLNLLLVVLHICFAVWWLMLLRFIWSITSQSPTESGRERLHGLPFHGHLRRGEGEESEEYKLLETP